MSRYLGRFALLAAVVGGSLATVAGSATASTAAWSAPTLLQPRCHPMKPNDCPIESAPQLAVNAHGVVAMTWVDTRGRVRVVVGDGRRARFGRPVTLGAGLRPAIAVDSAGAVVIAWSRSGHLRVARRAAGTRRFSAPSTLVAGAQRDFVQLAAQPNARTVVVYQHLDRAGSGQSRTTLQTVTLSRSGRSGAVAELGPGAIERDGFRAGPDGSVAVCCVTAPGAATSEAVATFAPGRGWSTLVPPLGPNGVVLTAAPRAGQVAVGAVDVVRRAEAASFGTPSLLRADAQGAFGPPLVAPVLQARRAFAPRVALDGSGRSVLLYQEKLAPDPFGRTAPIYAVTSASPDRQTVTPAAAMNPIVLAYRGGAIAAWQASGYRWGVAVERRGRFAAAPAPRGGGPSQMGEDFLYSRTMATGGRYAALAWTAHDGSIRVSVGVL